MLLEKVTGLNRTKLLSETGSSLTESQFTETERLIKGLLEQVPLQYLLGEAWFYGRKFMVNPSVLIPRPETEELVAWALEKVHNTPGLRLLDCGTGSGCIAITLALELSGSIVCALDFSTEALVPARLNALALQAEVTFMAVDLLSGKEDLAGLP